MDYDTINLLGLQPDNIQDINIVRSRDIININVTLTKMIKSCPCCSSLNANVKPINQRKLLILFSTLIKPSSITDVEDLYVKTVTKL